MGKDEQSIKEAIGDMLKEYNLEDKLNRTKVAESWEKVMGLAVAHRTQDIYVGKRTLYIKLNSAPLREDLLYHKDKIIQSLNEEVGSEVINDIVFN
jgi:hypothetical protein